MEYCGQIPYDIEKKQNQLLDEINRNGNVQLKQTMWQSEYQVSTNIKPITKSDNANVVITKLTSNSVSSGYISIISENNEADSKKDYYSVIKDKDQNILVSFSDAYKDNSAGSFSKDKFPLSITVSYITSGGKSVNEVIVIEKFNDYTIKVTAK